jgi:hypothetical protein
VLSSTRSRTLVALLSISLLALLAVPAVGADVATSSDAAGDAYKTAISKAKKKRTERLKRCAMKPSVAKQARCRKATNAEFASAKQKAEDARDEARYDAMSPQEKAEQRHDEIREQHECMKETRNPHECR